MSDPKKYLPPRRVMPGVPLPTLNQRNLDERSFHLSKIGADTFSGELVDCEGGNIIGPLTLSSDFAHNTGKFGVFGATAVAQIGGSIDVLAGMVTLGFRAASSNPPLNLGSGAITAGPIACADLTISGHNIITDTSTGTKIGTSAAQKLGFYNASPVAQIGGSIDVLAGLVTQGLRAASSNPPLDLGTGAITAGKITFTGALNASGSDGTAGFVLTSNGAAVNPSWQAASGGGGGSLATLSDVTLAAVAQGDVLYRGASVWQNLAHGTSGQVLTTGGAGANPAWATPTTGNATSSTAFGSEPGSPATGDLDFYSDGYSVSRWSGSIWSPWGRVNQLTAPPSAASLTQVNVTTATLVDSKGGLFLSAPNTSSAHAELWLKTLAAGAYTWVVHLESWLINSTFTGCGLSLRDSAGGKIITLEQNIFSNALNLAVVQWADANTRSVNAFTTTMNGKQFNWFKIHDDATNRTYSVSHDGVNWLDLLTEGRTTYLGVAPNQAGLFAAANGFAVGMAVYSWAGV